MKSRNYAAIALLLAVACCERFAFQALLVNVVSMSHNQDPSSVLQFSTLIKSTSVLSLVGLVIGGGLSMATRSRWVLVGASALLLLGHVLSEPMLYFAGFPLLTVATGVVRAPLYVALAEELDQHARIWKAVVVAALVYSESLAAEILVDFFTPLPGLALPSAASSLALLTTVLAFTACVVLAYALPGQPFRWTVTTELKADVDTQTTYRPEPTVVQRDSSPSRWIPLLAVGACLLSIAAHAIPRSVQTDAEPWISVFATLMIAALAAVLAKRDSRVSPFWIFGAGFALQAIGLVVVRHSDIDIIGVAAISACTMGQGWALSAASGCAFGAVSSRWAGLSAAGVGLASVLANEGAVASLARLLTPR
jgi:hypothetical protein